MGWDEGLHGPENVLCSSLTECPSSYRKRRRGDGKISEAN